MKCPSCGYRYIPGDDTCASCGHDLQQLDTSSKKGMGIDVFRRPVTEIPSEPPIFVGDTTPVPEVIRRMKENDINSVLVRSGDEVVGIFTERDILNRLVAGHPNLEHIHIGEVMSPNLVTLSKDDTIAVVINKMAIMGYRHIPVVDADQEYIRMLTVRDILSYLSKYLQTPPHSRGAV